MQIKPDVRVHGISTEILLAAMVVESVLKTYPYSCMITSGIEGQHSNGSRHYIGNALDFRTNHIPQNLLSQVVSQIKAGLTQDYDVVLENDHLHIEFQPKLAY